MKVALAICGVALCCGSATGLPFHLISYEAGGGLVGIAGQGISVNFGGFFTADGAGGNVLGGTPAATTASNEFEFDSHFSLDPWGPSIRNRTIAPTNNSLRTIAFYGLPYFEEGNPGGMPPFPSGDGNYEEIQASAVFPGGSFIAGPGSHIGNPAGDGSLSEHAARAGIAVVPTPVPSTLAPNTTGGRSNFDGVFVGRFTIREGALLSGGMIATTRIAQGVADTHELALNGPGVLFGTHSGPQLLALRAYQVDLDRFGFGPLVLANASAATAEGVNLGTPFGPADVYDLWVQVVPLPPTVAAFALLPWCGPRRRRI